MNGPHIPAAYTPFYARSRMHHMISLENRWNPVLGRKWHWV